MGISEYLCNLFMVLNRLRSASPSYTWHNDTTWCHFIHWLIAIILLNHLCYCVLTLAWCPIVQVIRKRIIEEGLRVDGRQLDEVRPLYCESNTYPVLHGSALFSRGDTQVRSIACSLSTVHSTKCYKYTTTHSHSIICLNLDGLNYIFNQVIVYIYPCK